MNVYEINGYWIASENPNEAFGHFMEETDNLEEVFFHDLVESEACEVSIKVRRLSKKEITAKNIRCCQEEDGCTFCEKKEDYVYLSLKDLMERQTHFPCVIAKEA